MGKIKWNTTELEIKQEMVSSDNRWHISKMQRGEDAKFHLVNYELLLTPSGSGENPDVCLETFIKSCDEYIEKVRKIQQEAKEILMSESESDE